MRAVVFILLAAVLFGTTGTARALGAPDVDVVSLGAARIVIGGGALAIVAWALSRRARAGAGGLAGAGGVAGADAPGGTRAVVVTVLIGGVAVVAYQPAFFLGTERNGVAVGTLVALGSAPLFTGAISWLLERRFPGARWVVATAVAVVGLAVLGASSASGVASTSSIDAAGLAGSLAAGLSYAVYTLASKRLLDRGWTGPTTMGAVFGTAAALGLLVLLGTDAGWILTVPGAATAVWLGLVTVLLAYLLFASGLRRLSAPTVSTLTLAEPLTAALLGVLVLGEQLSAESWIGLAAIGVGIVVLVARPVRRRSAATAPQLPGRSAR